jgi:hypothetical protein
LLARLKAQGLDTSKLVLTPHTVAPQAGQ